MRERRFSVILPCSVLVDLNKYSHQTDVKVFDVQSCGVCWWVVRVVCGKHVLSHRSHVVSLRCFTLLLSQLYVPPAGCKSQQQSHRKTEFTCSVSAEAAFYPNRSESHICLSDPKSLVLLFWMFCFFSCPAVSEHPGLCFSAGLVILSF